MCAALLLAFAEHGATQKNDAASKTLLSSPVFNEEVADALMERLAEGLRGHKLAQTQSVFAAERLDPQFGDRMRNAFEFYESFRLYYHVQEVSAENERGVVAADFDLECMPRQSELAPVRKHARVRLEFERMPLTAKARKNPPAMVWRVVAITPPGFFFDF